MALESTLGDVRDPSLAEEGLRFVEWAAREMPVLRLISDRFRAQKPLTGIRVAGCLHVTAETANLALALQAGGAEVVLCASNPLSTQDTVASALNGPYGIPTFAIKGENDDTYYRHILAALDTRPHVTLDDGADLVATLHTRKAELIEGMIGGTEETTTGVLRLRSMSEFGRLRYPIIAVNAARTKHLFDNRYGTGQSTLDGITRATNMLWAGKTVVVAGYGWCGRGIAMRARGMGSQVIVTEVAPVRALEATMDGFRVMPMLTASALGDVFITVTGGIAALDAPHFERMKDGAVIANSGHFNVEINIEELRRQATTCREPRPMVEEHMLPGGRRVYLLGQGRLVNLAAAEGHPSAVMDMSFANQALSVEHLVHHHQEMEPGIYPVPNEIDESVARIKLEGMGIDIDRLTLEQSRYFQSWESGT